MKNKIIILFAVLFIASILFSFIFGADIRDMISPKVEVMSPTFYTFSDGSAAMSGLSSSSFHSVGDKTYAFIVEEREDTGEKAYFAKHIEVTTGKSDGRCTELTQSSHFNAMYICSSDKEIHDGDRVVIARVLNSP